jgi:hypothetical protein
MLFYCATLSRVISGIGMKTNGGRSKYVGVVDELVGGDFVLPSTWFA